MPKLHAAFFEFNDWMRKYEESHRANGNYDYNKALVRYLTNGSGFRYVKSYEELCQLAEIAKKHGYKMTNPPCQPIDFYDEVISAGSQEFYGEKPSLSGITKQMRLDKALLKFHFWMRKHEESHRANGNYDDNNKALVHYLTNDAGFRYVKSYEELCQLAEMAKKTGYKTTNPPCQPIDFYNEVTSADYQDFYDERLSLSDGTKQKRLDKALLQFDRWMKKYEKSHRANGNYNDNNKALVCYLKNGGGCRYIKSYEELCQLAEMAEKNGYKTTNPPCRPMDVYGVLLSASFQELHGEKSPLRGTFTLFKQPEENKSVNIELAQPVNQPEIGCRP